MADLTDLPKPLGPVVDNGDNGNIKFYVASINIRYFLLFWAIIAIFIVLSVAFLLFQVMVNQYYEELYKVSSKLKVKDEKKLKSPLADDNGQSQ